MIKMLRKYTESVVDIAAARVVKAFLFPEPLVLLAFPFAFCYNCQIA
jgi:hypothetical protein